MDHNADVNLVDQWNRTVLANAAADNGDPECLKRLVDAGADINWRDCHKGTSLGYAAFHGDIETLHALKDGRLKVLNPLERDNEGLSARDLFNSEKAKI